MRITRKLPEVPGLDVVIETEAVSGAELGQDIHDVLLLFWGDHVFTVMDSVVGAIATTKIAPYTVASLRPVSLWNVIIEMCEAPCFLHHPFLSEILAPVVLPNRRINGWSMMTTFGQQQPGLIMHATRLLCAFIVEAQGISHRNFLVCQFLLFHICVTLFAAKIYNFSRTAKE